jgi:hypothetical protein
MLLRNDLLFLPSILRLLFVSREHRKRLATQIQHPLTLQLETFRFLYKDPSYPWWETLAIAGRRWTFTLLGAGYSCSTDGDGPRSSERWNRQRRVKYNAKIQHRRHTQNQDRTGAEALVVPMLHLDSLPPLQGTRTRPMKAVRPRIPDPSALSFYGAHPGTNTWLEVRTGNNITGTAQDRVVFAPCPIPPHTRLAPYLGRVCSLSSTGP